MAEGNGYVGWKGFTAIMTLVILSITSVGTVAWDAHNNAAEAYKKAVEARPDPFTGTQGKELREDLRERQDVQYEIVMEQLRELKKAIESCHELHLELVREMQRASN